MDKKLFEETLKQLAEVETPEYQETVYDTELDPETGVESITEREVLVQGQPTLKKLKPCLTTCEFCDKTVTDQLIHSKQAQEPVPHWRHRCVTCNCYLDPETLKPMTEELATALGKISRYWKNKRLGLKKWQRTPRITDNKTKTAAVDFCNSTIEISSEIDPDTGATIRRYSYLGDK